MSLAIFNNSSLCQSSWLYLGSCGRVRTCGRFGDGDDNGGDCIGMGETFGDGCIVTGDTFGDECIVMGVSGTGMLCGGVITPLNSRLKSNDELVADGGCINDAT